MNANIKSAIACGAGRPAHGARRPARGARSPARGFRPRFGAALLAAVLGLAVLSALPAAAQPAIAQGRLIVATEAIGDSSWAETVLLVLHHDTNGTLGIAINRPTWVEPATIAPAIGGIETLQGNVFRGGPVSPTQMIFLVRNPPLDTVSAAPILNGVYAGSDLSVLESLVPLVEGERRGIRLYAGHAEWRPGGLEREIAQGLWKVIDGSADSVFAAEPARLWSTLRSDDLRVGPVSPRPDAGLAASIDRR